MRISKLLFLVVLVSSVMFAQERFIITPGGDAIPVKKGETEFDVAKKAGLIGEQETPNSVQADCPSSLDAGNVRVGSGRDVGGFVHAAGDVNAMIYVVPFSGNISAVHFRSYAVTPATFSNYDATLRISKCNIRNSGNTSATYWGFFPDVQDVTAEQSGHRGNTPWPENADSAYVPGAAGTKNPIGENLWGGEIGGYPITWPNATQTNNISMLSLGYEPAVTAGDTIIITIQKSAFAGSTTGTGVGLYYSTPETPYRMLKYYYFGRLSNSAPGWWAREFDTFIWFTITVTGDVPPTVTSSTTLRNTISTSPQPVSLTAFDCNIAAPADTGVASANLYYAVGAGSYQPAIPMTGGNGVWSANIPGQPLDNTVTYYADVTDIHGFKTTLGARSYRIPQFSRAGYTYSTPAFSFTDIANAVGATELPGTVFFNANAEPFDDGIAGPIPIGGNFNFFGRDTMRYAWVSANGALGLTGAAGDTNWVNSTGTRTGGFGNFNIPSSTAPRNWIAGFWNDLYLAGTPTAPGGHGSVWYKQVGTQLIVQWNKVGNFNAASDTNTTFQIVLDRADSSMTFKYLDVGSTGLELTGYVAAQASATNLWTFINASGYPVESRPANNKSIKLKQSITTGVEEPGGQLPTKFALYENYPNPFNPSTKISYAVPARLDVKLSVYNILGQEVATLVNEVKEAGTYNVTFSSANLPSGVYFYTLRAGQYTDTKKMVLMK